MVSHLPPISFYIPHRQWPENFPDCAANFLPKNTVHAWIAQTFLHLREADLSCQITDKIPNEGILIAHRVSLPYDIYPNPKLLVVCIKADQNPHPYAQLHVCQNAKEAQYSGRKIQSLSEDRYLLGGELYYIPHWPQPGLIPRDSNRGDKFENIAYYGVSYNLAKEFLQPGWQEYLESLGLRWIREQQRKAWHDYSKVDAIIAVRSFTPETDYPWKPASKLFNCWRAGIPAILGPESAFRGERKSELDYLEVSSYTQAKEAVKRLKDDVSLRRAMIENGYLRAKEIEVPMMIERWRKFLLEVAVPAYEKWRSRSYIERQLFFVSRYLAIQTNNIQKKLLGSKK